MSEMMASMEQAADWSGVPYGSWGGWLSKGSIRATKGPGGPRFDLQTVTAVAIARALRYELGVRVSSVTEFLNWLLDLPEADLFRHFARGRRFLRIEGRKVKAKLLTEADATKVECADAVRDAVTICVIDVRRVFERMVALAAAAAEVRQAAVVG